MGLIIAWLTLVIIALNLGGDAYAWNSSVIIGLLVGAGCAFVGFIVAENYAPNPVVPMGLFASWKTRNVPIMTGEHPRRLLIRGYRFNSYDSCANSPVFPSVRLGKRIYAVFWVRFP